MVSELENTLRAVPSEMAATVSSLYRDRFSELNELCDIYYDHGGSSRNKSMVFNKLTDTIEAIKSDKHRLNELEVAVDKYRNGLMSRLRSEMPRLNERDLRVALYLLAGFSNRAIAIFIDSDPVTVSKLRYNIKQKIKNANLPSSEELLAALSDK
jgi:DNA-binding CsgD family transcriptional regulator